MIKVLGYLIERNEKWHTMKSMKTDGLIYLHKTGGKTNLASVNFAG